MIKVIEFLNLIHGNKPCLRTGVYDEEKKEYERICLELGLSFKYGQKKIVLCDEDKKFSHKGIMVDVDDTRRGMRFLYVGLDKGVLDFAIRSEESRDSYRLGLLLGYPKCCVKWFCEREEEMKTGDNDYTDISNSGNGSWMLNIKRLKDDICLVSHFPCSMNCGESKEYAERSFSLLAEYDSGLAEKFKTVLNTL